MPVMIKNTDDQYFTYEEAKEVKESGGKYVIYDAHGSVLGVHPISSVEELTTEPLGQPPKA